MRKIAGVLLTVMAIAGAIIGVINIILANKDIKAQKDLQLADARKVKAEKAAIRRGEALDKEENELPQEINENDTQNLNDKNKEDE